MEDESDLIINPIILIKTESEYGQRVSRGDMHRMGKKQQKQFPLINKENCIIYLCRIISSCELCMDRYKIYNGETEKILEQYKGKEKIPHEIYAGLSDKMGHVMCYLLNLLGDCQTSSISYF